MSFYEEESYYNDYNVIGLKEDIEKLYSSILDIQEKQLEYSNVIDYISTLKNKNNVMQENIYKIQNKLNNLSNKRYYINSFIFFVLYIYIFIYLSILFLPLYLYI
jgi:prefoldin subunit 5